MGFRCVRSNSGSVVHLPHTRELCLHTHTHWDIEAEQSHAGGSALCPFSSLAGRFQSSFKFCQLAGQVVLPHCAQGIVPSSPLPMHLICFFFSFWLQVWICSCVTPFPTHSGWRCLTTSTLRPCARGRGQGLLHAGAVLPVICVDSVSGAPERFSVC